jgi:hypothetical protein
MTDKNDHSMAAWNRLSMIIARAHISLCLLALAAALLTTNLHAAKIEKQEPIFTLTTKILEDSVYIDTSLKAYPELYDNLLAEGRRQFVQWRSEADKELREYPKSFEDRSWSTIRDYDKRSVIGRYISVTRIDNTNTGGAHPNITDDTILWDTQINKRISIRPFFTETASNGPTMTLLATAVRLAVAREKIKLDPESKKGPPEALVEEDDQLKNGVQPDLLKIGPVSLAPSTEAGKSSGLTFHYSPEVVGPNVEGGFIVFVSWTAFKTQLTPEGERIFGGDRPASDIDDN